MRLGKKPAQQPDNRSTGQILLEALKEADAQHRKDIKHERKRRRRLLGDMPDRVRTSLIVIIVALIVLVGDGLRREGQEFNARLDQFTGSIIMKDRVGRSKIPKAGIPILDGETIITGENSTATLQFPDGSAIELQPQTQFEVRLLDYARGGLRDRSFMVRYGAVVAHVSKFFGLKSRATFCTPTAVAAVRGTGFQVFYDPNARQSALGVVEGLVEYRTPVARNNFTQGQMVASRGYQMGNGANLAQTAGTRIGTRVHEMTQKYERPPSFLHNVEMTINGILDPALQVLGLSPGGWGFQSMSFARLGAAKKVMLDLQRHILSQPGDEVPRIINPVTLEELQMDAKERNAILESLSGRMLETYVKLGPNSYRVMARARDKKRTLLELSESGVREVPERR